MTERRGSLERLMHRGFLSMVRRGLRGVWLRGALPHGPFVWAANHHSWWDPFLAAIVLDRVGQSACLIMQQENLGRYGFTRRLGVFGTSEHRTGLEYLHRGRVLVIYPEGELRTAGPPGELASGAAWYARRAGVPLCAIATRVVLRGEEAPEALLSCSTVDTSGTLPVVTARLADHLAGQLRDLDAGIEAVDPRRPLPGYRLVVRGRRSWDERIDAVGRWRPWAS